MKYIRTFTMRLGKRNLNPAEGAGKTQPRWIEVRLAARIRVEVDTEAIAFALGHKALNSKSGRSGALNGAVVVKAEEVPSG